MNKLGFKEKDVGHMTLRKWNRLYEAYKCEWDKEAMMKYRRILYLNLNMEVTIDDVIPM